MSYSNQYDINMVQFVSIKAFTNPYKLNNYSACKHIHQATVVTNRYVTNRYCLLPASLSPINAIVMGIMHL